MTCLLLRKQFWMTFMMKFAASRSVMLGLNLCLEKDHKGVVTGFHCLPHGSPSQVRQNSVFVGIYISEGCVLKMYHPESKS